MHQEWSKQAVLKALERKEEGKKWLERALRVKVKTEEDKVARKDVEKLLKKHFDVKQQ